jgi:hypothetical protein
MMLNLYGIRRVWQQICSWGNRASQGTNPGLSDLQDLSSAAVGKHHMGARMAAAPPDWWERSQEEYWAAAASRTGPERHRAAAINKAVWPDSHQALWAGIMHR